MKSVSSQEDYSLTYFFKQELFTFKTVYLLLSRKWDCRFRIVMLFAIRMTVHFLLNILIHDFNISVTLNNSAFLNLCDCEEKNGSNGRKKEWYHGSVFLFQLKTCGLIGSNAFQKVKTRYARFL